MQLKKAPGSFLPNRMGQLSSDAYSLNVVVRYGAMVGFGGHFLFIFLFALLNLPSMRNFNIFSCVIFCVCFLLNQRGYTHIAVLIGTAEILAHATLAVVMIGWESGFHYYILGLTPLIYYSQLWRTTFKNLLVTFLCFVYITLFLVTQTNLPLRTISQQQMSMVGGINIITIFIVFAVVSHFYRSAANHAEEGLKRANQKLEYLAHTDPLTKLINRRNMIDRIAQEVTLFHKTGLPFSILLGDIDNFKIYNDTYGHEAGDQILIKVSEEMGKGTREKDSIARWGGEEFLVLLPGIDQESAGLIGDRIRERIAATQFNVGNGNQHITMTFGVSTYSIMSDTNQCIRQADQAMYEGKHRGRNCVVIYKEPIE
jgi:diguanylate cyclase (GGDEF)-like protein